jgi:molybdate transport system substrate-binding protein
MFRRVAVLIVALVLVASCTDANNGSVVSGNEPLIVFAAADLQFALTEIAADFAAAGHPRPTISFGSTGTFSQQIENGAPADVFFAADERALADLEAKGLLLAGTRRPYAIGDIVLVERAGLPPVTTLSDLARPELRTVAIADPEHAPYGRAAREALVRSGAWPGVEPKLVFGENVAQAFQFVRTGNADAGIVALSVALGLPGTHYTRIAASLHDPIVQAAAVLARTRQPDLARAFLAYANGPAARPILTAYGFAPTETR